MRTLNVKLTVILLVVIVIVAGSTHLLHSFQLQRKSSAFKNQAIAAWNDNPRRDSDALILMNAYLVLDPRDIEAREDLGFWYADSGRFSYASATLEELVRALEKQEPPDVPRIQKVREKLILAAMAQGNCADAVYHLTILKKELPGDVDVLNRLGKCQVTLGQEEEAIKTFTAAIQLKPDRIDIYYNKAMALRFPPVQRLAEAQACMAQMIAEEHNAKTPGAHHVYGLWLAELGKYAEALKQAETTLKLKPGHSGALYLAGQCELALRHFPQAQQYAQRGIDAAPQEFAMYTLMADVLDRSNQRDGAIEILKKGVAVNESQAAKAQLLWHLANLYLDGGNGQDSLNVADAVDCIGRMRDFHFPAVQLAFLDARVLYANDDWRWAREGFEVVRPQLNEFPQLMKCLDYWIGYCYTQQGNPDQAMAAFRRSLSFDKFYFKAHAGIAQIFEGNGQLKDAVEEYQQAALGNPSDADAWQAFAKSLLVWNLHRPADERNWEVVEHALQHAETLNPREGQIKLMGAEVLLAQGRNKQADELLAALRQDSPQGIEFWVAQANLAARQGRIDEAKQILDNAKAKLGDHVLIRLVRAAFLLRELGLQAGPEIDKLAANTDAFSLDEKTRLWNGLIKNLLEIKEYERAKRLCRQIAREQPHDATIRYRLFELALTTHDVRDSAASLAELDRLLNEVDVIAGRGPLWMYGKAVRLSLEARQGKPELFDAAMNYADQAQKMRFSWSRPQVLKGEICRQRGNDDEALVHYLQASVNGDRDLDFIRILLQMLFERQRYQEAEQVIHRLDSNQTVLNVEIQKEEAEIFAIWGDFDRALESANTAYDPNSSDYRDHVWHGQVLKILAGRALQEGHQDKLQAIADSAEQSLHRACLIAPNAADCRVALVQLLVATHQMKKALIAASDAQEMIPSSAAPLAMGYIYEALGEARKAGQSYEKAVQLKPDLPQAIRLLAEFYLRRQDFPHAAPLIDRLLSSEVKSSESDLVSARRMKAAILVSQGYSKLKEATDLIDRNLASPLASIQDKRIKVQLLRADPRRTHSRETLEMAESLVALGGAEPEPDDRFQLAHLYLARGDWDRCREQMEKLVNGSQPNPGYLAAYVRMLLDQDELAEAESWLDRLERASQPGNTVALRAELLFRGKEWGKVPEFLDGYVQHEKSGSKEQLARMLLVAQILEDFGGRLSAPAQRELAQSYFDNARQKYESCVQKCPGSELLITGFLARHGTVEEALDGIERYGEKSDPQQLFAVISAIVSRPVTTPVQLKKLEALVAALLDKTQRPAALLVALAEIQSALNRPQDSEAIYREILRKDPSDDMARNNLSMILALQKTKLDEALDLIDKTIERSGPQGPFLDTRAVVLIARHEPQKALEELEGALAEKTTPARLFHKAWACLDDGNAAKAKAVLQAARNAGLEDSMLVGPEREICKQIGKADM